DVDLRIVGTSELEHFRALARSVGVADAVSVVGRVDDALAEIDLAHVGLMCSRSEAFGRVTVEYLRRGRPVIGTRSGGTPELVEEGITGWLYAPGNYEALAALIELFASSNQALAQFSQAALYRNAKRFLMSDYVAQFCGLLGTLSKPESLQESA